jgi:hypothetical protein
VKIDQFSNASRPRIARFNEIGDAYDLTLTKDPQWVDDPANSGEQLLRIVGQDDRNIYWQVRARSQMPDAIFDAMLDADVDEIVVGGRLRVEFVEYHGQAKIYGATYKPPADSAAPY